MRIVYERAAVQGRMLPEGLRYIDSWVAGEKLDQCFQLMEAGSPDKVTKHGVTTATLDIQAGKNGGQLAAARDALKAYAAEALAK